MSAVVKNSNTTLEIDKEIRNFDQQFEAWVSQKMNAVDDLQRQHLDNLQRGKATVDELETQQTELKSVLQNKTAAFEALNNVVSNLQIDVDQLSDKIRSIPSDISKVSSQQIELAKDSQKTAADIVSIRNEMDSKVSTLFKGIDKFRNALGLDIQVDDGAILLTFTCVDPANENRRFSFRLNVNDADQYAVTKCEPMIQELNTLVNQLNTGNNFSLFVQLMRREFQKMC